MDGTDAVYVIEDHSSEEVYYHLGTFRTLADALAALDKAGGPDNALPNNGADREDFCRVEIHEHRLGWHCGGRLAYAREWKRVYSDEDDDGTWRRIAEKGK